MTGVLTVFIIFVLFPVVILGFILLSRYLKYRETLTMLQHGITPPPPPVALHGRPMPRPPVVVPPVVVQQGNGGSRGTLIWGLVLSAIGLALTLALLPIGFIANSASGNSVNFPLGLGPWMLVGFVPLFIGLALILGYVIMRPERDANLRAQWEAGFPIGGAVGAYPAQWASGASTTTGPIPTPAPTIAPEPVVREETVEATPSSTDDRS